MKWLFVRKLNFFDVICNAVSIILALQVNVLFMFIILPCLGLSSFMEIKYGTERKV